MARSSVGPDGEGRAAGVTAHRLLEHPPRRELVAVVDLAARVCDVPMATINLLTDTSQHQIAAVGFDATVCRREDSLCAHVLDYDEPVVVPDARRDPRFADNPFVSGALGAVRFYAAHQLVSRGGVAFGTLCVFDTEPRTLDADQIAALGTLAARVVDILELSVRTRELAESLAHVEAVKSELEESNRRLASFAGQVSHDLKNPLTSVAMSLSIVREELARQDEDSDALWLLDRAISGSSRMAALIDDVLDYAKVGGSLKADRVDLGEVLAEVTVDLAGPLTGVVLQVADLPTVTGDAVQLRAVLQNLLSNAAKFRAPGRVPRIAVSSRRLAGCWRIEVTDNGRGVSPERCPDVFEPLVRGDDSVDGTGIGLATCRRIVTAHDGRIGLDPVPGGGTTFWFELPD